MLKVFTEKKLRMASHANRVLMSAGDRSLAVIEWLAMLLAWVVVFLFLIVALGSSAAMAQDVGDLVPLAPGQVVAPAAPVTKQQSPQRKAMVETGRLLFFDSRLSQDNTTSCGSCHDPSKGTSDGRAVGIGRIGGRNPQTGERFLTGIKGNRRTPAILNAALIPGSAMFWDGRRVGLFNQSSGPIENPDEMGNQTVRQVANRINRIPGYQTRMQAAFGSEQVTVDRLLNCIVAFEQDEMVATDTLLARHLDGQETVLSESAKRGAEIFKANCVQCHKPPLFTNGGFSNTGVEFLYTDEFNDVGLQKTNGEPGSLRAFKVPSLIGVSLRPPYMHNGSLPTLQHVVEHYSRGATLNGQRDPGLSRFFPQAKGAPRGEFIPLGLSAQQKRDLDAALSEGTVPLDLKVVTVPKLEEFPR